MAEQLFNHFADIPALQAEKAEVLKIYGEIKQGIMDLSKLGFKIDAAKGIKEISDASKQLQQVQDQLLVSENKLAEAEKRLADARAQIISQTKQQGDSYKTLNSELSVNIQKQIELKQKIAELGTSIKKLEGFAAAAKGNKEFTDELVRMTEEQTRLKLELQDTTKFIKNQAREMSSAAGSVDELEAKLLQLQQSYDALNATDRDTDTGKARLKEIQDLDLELKALEGSTGRFQRNVGNYTGSAKIIVDALKDVENQVSNLKQKQEGLVNFSKANPIGFKMGGGQEQLNQVNAQLGFITKQAQSLTTITNDPKFLNVAAKTGDAIAETKAFTKTLIDLEQQGLKDTEVYRQVQVQLAKLTDTIADTRAEVKAMSSDTRGFDLFAGAVGTLSSSFQVVASSAELFDGTNKEIQKSIQKLIAIQNISNGVRQIATDLTTRGSAANKAYAFIQAQVAIVTNASATATTRLNAALKLSGIGLLITGIGFLIAKLADFGAETNSAEKEMNKLNKTIDEQNKLLDKNINKIDFNGKIRLERAKQQGASFKELGNIELSVLQEQQNKLAKEVSNTGARIVGLIDQRQKKIAALEASKPKSGQIDVGGSLYQQTLDINKKIEAEKVRSNEEILRLNKQYSELSEKKQKKDEEVILKGEQNKTAIVEDTNKKNEKKKKESTDRSIEDEKKALLELQKFRLEQAANEAGAFKEFGPVAGRVAAVQAEFELRKKVIEKQAEIELEDDKVTASKRELIHEKTAAALIHLENATYADILRIRQQSAQDGQDEAAAEIERFEKLEEEKFQIKLEADERQRQIGQDKIEIGRDNELEALERRFQKQFKAARGNEEKEKKAVKDYERAKEEIQSRANLNVLKNELYFYEYRLNLMKTFSTGSVAEIKAIEAAEKALAATRRAIAEAESKGTVTNSKDKKEDAETKVQKALDKVVQINGVLEDAIGGALNAAATRRKNIIQDQIDDIEKLKAAEIDRINASGDSEEKKAARIKLVEARAAAERENLERKKRQIDLQTARFEKAAAIMNIILNTAVAVTKATTPFGKAIAIASGAVQLGIAIATPLPKFFKGTHSSPAGPAEVAEQGRELAVEPGGRLKLFTHHSVQNLVKGTRIFPNQVTERILAATNIPVGKQVQVLETEDEYGEEIVYQLKEIKKRTGFTVIINQGIDPGWWSKHMKN